MSASRPTRWSARWLVDLWGAITRLPGLSCESSELILVTTTQVVRVLELP
jgi:hypothetical protein